MSRLEQAFIFMTVALHLGLLTKVGTDSHDWSRPEFVFAFSACVLIFIQFLIRYLAITHRYKTETTIQSWVVSLLIVAASLTLIQSASHFPFWFLVYGILLLLATVKTKQVMSRLASTDMVERRMRFQESRILEMSFGIFMVVLYVLAMVGSKIFSSLNFGSVVFLGTLFGLYFAALSTIVMVSRMLKNKSEIEDYLRDYLQNIEVRVSDSGHQQESGHHQESFERYDVFISHATEDKDDVVRPLAKLLQAKGLSVWYDEFEIGIGDSVRRGIDSGVAKSAFAVVVLSQAFFEKNWTQYELDGLITQQISGKQKILPVWHRISKDEVMSRSPSLADRLALKTSDFTVEQIAEGISDVIKRSRKSEPQLRLLVAA